MITPNGVAHILAEASLVGHPKTKGSLEFVTAKHVREKPGSARWRKLVAERLRDNYVNGAVYDAAWAEGCRGPFSGRVGVLIVSYLEPPRGWLEKVAQWFLGQFSGDVDKLTRNVLDAAVDAGVIVDDGQVVDLFSYKRLAKPGAAGQRIQIWITPEGQEW